MRRISGVGREPRLDMSAEDVVDLVDCLEGRGIKVWLHGGWGVDALLATQTRPHDDLDMIVELRTAEALRVALAERGYVFAGGGPPKSFELTDDEGRQVDVHPIVFTESGDGTYKMALGNDWIYPASGFEGAGSVLVVARPSSVAPRWRSAPGLRVFAACASSRAPGRVTASRPRAGS